MANRLEVTREWLTNGEKLEGKSAWDAGRKYLNPKERAEYLTSMFTGEHYIIEAGGKWSPWDTPEHAGTSVLTWYGPTGDTSHSPRWCVLIYLQGFGYQRVIPYTGKLDVVNPNPDHINIAAGVEDDYHDDNISHPDDPLWVSFRRVG